MKKLIAVVALAAYLFWPARSQAMYVDGMSTYAYVKCDPIQRRDPRGLGIDFVDKTPPLKNPPKNTSACGCSDPAKPQPSKFEVQCYDEPIGRHCWIAILDSGGNTMGTVSGSPSKNAGIKAILPFVDPGIVIYKPDLDMGQGAPKPSYRSPITIPSDKTPCKFADCLNDEANKFEMNKLPYSAAGGPNSNTLANFSMKFCGGSGKFPDGAISGAIGSDFRSVWGAIYDMIFD